MKNARILRLTSGEQIVCELLDDQPDDECIGVKMAFIVTHDLESNRLLYSAFAPFSSATGVVGVRKTSLTYMSTPSSQMVDQYIDLLEGNLNPTADE